MDTKRLEEIQKLKDDQKSKSKGKGFKNMSSSEKDELLETVCRILGLI